MNDFLLRIRELGEKRDKEDEERTRRLEEDILQGRKEREARRAGTFTVSVLAAWAKLVFNHHRRPATKCYTNHITRTRQVTVSDKIILQRRHPQLIAVTFEPAGRPDKISAGFPAIRSVARHRRRRSFSKRKPCPKIRNGRQCWVASKHATTTVKACRQHQ